MDDAKIESLNSLPGYDLESRPSGRMLPVCDRETCCHYGEGCALGYPIEWEWLKLDRDQYGQKNSTEIRLIYSTEFRDYWNKAIGEGRIMPDIFPSETELAEKLSYRQERAGLVLPCSHKGCSFDRCDLLKEESMMSSYYRSVYMKPSFEVIKKQEEAQKLEKYNAEKGRFYGALEDLNQLVCPNCHIVREYKVFMPAEYKRGEIICKGCGRSIFVLNHL